MRRREQIESIFNSIFEFGDQLADFAKTTDDEIERQMPKTMGALKDLLRALIKALDTDVYEEIQALRGGPTVRVFN